MMWRLIFSEKFSYTEVMAMTLDEIREANCAMEAYGEQRKRHTEAEGVEAKSSRRAYARRGRRH